MACNEFKKYTTAEMNKLISNHLELETRGEHKHSNLDIDNSKAHENYYLKINSSDELRSKYRERLKTADELHPPKRVRKDRKTAVSINCYVPKEISLKGDDIEKEFLEKTIKFYERQFGADNVIGMSVHKDEIHNYIDKNTKEMRESLVHGHLLVVPYAKWQDAHQEREGINSRAFMDRGMLYRINQAYNEYVKQEFGIEFNTGEGIHNGLSVEELKIQTKQLQKEYAQKNTYQKEAERLQKNIDRYNKACLERKNAFYEHSKNARSIVAEVRKETIANFKGNPKDLELEISKQITYKMRDLKVYKTVYGVDYGQKEDNPYYERLKNILKNENDIQKLQSASKKFDRKAFDKKCEGIAEKRFNNELAEMKHEYESLNAELKSDKYKDMDIEAPNYDELLYKKEALDELRFNISMYEAYPKQSKETIAKNLKTEINDRKVEDAYNQFKEIIEGIKDLANSIIEKAKTLKDSIMSVYRLEAVPQARNEDLVHDNEILRKQNQELFDINQQANREAMVTKMMADIRSKTYGPKAEELWQDNELKAYAKAYVEADELFKPLIEKELEKMLGKDSAPMIKFFKFVEKISREVIENEIGLVR